MHSFRLCYIALGLFTYIQSTISQPCSSNDKDIAMRKKESKVTFRGKLIEMIRHEDDLYAKFRVKSICKEEDGVIRKSDRRKIIVGPVPDIATQCNTTDGLFVVFLDGERVRTRRRKNRATFLYKTSSFPLISSYKCNKPEKQRRHKKVRASIEPRKMSLVNDEDIVIQCKVSGRPRPEIIWFYNDEQITGGHRIKFSRRRKELRIRRAKVEDAGYYRCHATGRYNNASAIVHVEITTKPVKEHAELCHEQSYCLNGGTCYKLPLLQMTMCECNDNYQGDRCQEKRTGLNIFPKGRRRRRMLRHRHRH